MLWNSHASALSLSLFFITLELFEQLILLKKDRVNPLLAPTKLIHEHMLENVWLLICFSWQWEMSWDQHTEDRKDGRIFCSRC